VEDVLSTYRVQLRPGFGFAELRDLVPYLSRLGISHVYLSPIQRARSGSPHGYDVVDPTEVNPELGGMDQLQSLVAELRRHRMGAVLDIVPNHVATGSENPFWQDVLEHGRSSRYAAWFDIDWGPATARRPYRILLPVLGDRLGRVIDSGELRLEYERGRFKLRYHEQSFPVDPGTLPLVLGTELEGMASRVDPTGQEDVRELHRIIGRLRALPSRNSQRDEVGAERAAAAAQALEGLERLTRASGPIRQHVERAVASHTGGGSRALRRLVAAQPYRLAYWRRAAREINYRRFFTISHLVALRQEDPRVFHATHVRVLEWVEAGLLDGLRIDHVDGLLDPTGYLARLRQEIETRLAPEAAASFPIYVEKILARDEALPREWPVAGTTGYDFLAQVEDLFLDAEGHRRIEADYRRFIHRASRFRDLAGRAKRSVLDGPLLAEARRLGRLLEGAARERVVRAQLDRARLAEAAAEVIVCLPVYRTYWRPGAGGLRDFDRSLLMGALAEARARGRALVAALDTLEHVLLENTDEAAENDGSAARAHFIQRLQQVCVSVAAKGVEDTVFYVHVPLVSRNEVGGEPDAPLEDPTSALQRANGERGSRWPQAMLAVTTHDTKRSADVRARLDALSELPELWGRKTRRWHRWNRRHRTRLGWRYAPDRNAEYLLYQTLVGIWPLPSPGHADSSMQSIEARLAADDVERRVQEYIVKAAREAKTHTSWVNVNAQYEAALESFVADLLSAGRSARFLGDLNMVAERIARPGLWNSLARTLIQLTAPGTPDIYQGDELWNYSLVDPDNRRSVDYRRRLDLLETVKLPEEGDADPVRVAELLRSAEDGRLKLFIMMRLLGLRRSQSALFRAGDYLPLVCAGSLAAHVFAFARRLRDRRAIAIAPRLTIGLSGDSGEPPTGAAVWRDTAVRIPAELAARRWRCAISGVTVEGGAGGGDLPVGAALGALPVALLVPLEGPD